MVFITGEIGTNHCGSIAIAKKIIDVAVEAGCDAVKFQKKDVNKIYTVKFLDTHLESPWGNTQRDMRLHREFSIEDFKKIDMYCKKRKIPWFVSCWDVGSQIEMRKFNTKYNKVASAMLLHKNLLEVIAEEKKYTFISTGMTDLKNISKAIRIFKKHDCPFELMHSHSSYPMPLNEANLNMIPQLRKKFKCDVGYSGHEKTASVVCLCAVMLGATSIERHITLDRSMYGSDQSASLEKPGLERLVRDIHRTDLILGDGIKRIWDSEKPVMKKLRNQ